MASRTARSRSGRTSSAASSSTSTSSAAGRSTPTGAAAAAAAAAAEGESVEREVSFTSPTRRTRIEEKTALQHLNDRLAAYIERVRSLETENARLSIHIQETEQVQMRDRSKMRDSYEAELADARRLLDQVAKEKARIQIEADKAVAEHDDLRQRVAKLEKDLKRADNERMGAQGLVQDLQARLNTAESERKYYENEAAKSADDSRDASKQVETARRQLEEETVLRVDLENRLQSLREELAFNKQLYDQELDEIRRKRQTDIRTIGKEKESEFKQKLQLELQQLRERFDGQMAVSRQEVEDMYEAKLRDMMSYAERNRESATEARAELGEMRSHIEKFERERDSFRIQAEAAERKLREAVEELNSARDMYASRLRAKEDEIGLLRREIDKMMADYRDLMDTKIQLDVEIEAYRQMLEGEETRLHLTPTPPPKESVGVSSTMRRGAKRKRVMQDVDDFDVQSIFRTERGSTGPVEIHEHCVDGKSITLHNPTDKEVAVGGWCLKRIASGKEVSYKFHSRQTLKAGKTMTVYSSDSGQTHRPPEVLVMKNQQWPVGDIVRSFVIDSDQEEVAWCESRRSYGSGYAEGVENGQEGDQRCSIM